MYICGMKDYYNIHKWLKNNHGKASKCENELCDYKNPKRFEWALLKGKDHKPDRNNYIQLCPSCHRKYDITEQIRINMSNGRKGKGAHNKGIDSRIINDCKECGKHYKTYHKTSKFCSRSCAGFYRERIKRNEK